MRTLIFETKDGKQYNLNDLGVRVVEFEPESLDSLNDVTLIPGYGYVVNKLGYNARYINAVFRIHSVNLTDYAMHRMELFNLFVQDDDFYIIDQKDVSIRWHVRSDGKFQLSRALKSGDFDVSFLCVNQYGVSNETTLELSNSKTWSEDKFKWNGMITWDDQVNYTFTTTNFDLFNLGNAKVEPGRQMLDITVRAASNTGIKIRNITTGDEYIYSGTLSTDDVLYLRGTRSFKNNVSVFSDTNKNLITLAPGRNSFSITTERLIDISFDFKFLFK